MGIVDWVIYNRGNVLLEKWVRVKVVMEELGYEFNIIVCILAICRVMCIVLFLLDFSIDFYWELFNVGMNKVWYLVKYYGVEFDYYYFNFFDQADFVKKVKVVFKARLEVIVFLLVFLKVVNELLEVCVWFGIMVFFFNMEFFGENVLIYVG